MTSETSDPADGILRADAIEPAAAAAIAAADGWIAEAVARTGRSFDDVFRRFDHAGRIVRRAYGRTAGLRDLHPDPAFRDAARAAGEAIERWAYGLAEREDVARVVGSFAGADAELDDEQRAVLAWWRLDVRDAGWGLDEASRTRLAELRDITIAAPGRYMPAHFRNEVVTVHPSEVGGLPSVIVDGFGAPGEDGSWTVEVDEAVSTAVQDSGSDRALRERVLRAWMRRGHPEAAQVLAEAADARRAIAHLLGRPSWLALRADRMAIGGIDALDAFLDGLEPRLAEHASADLEAMRLVLAAETGDADAVVEEWDWRYLDARQRARAGSDPDALRAYLPFEACLASLASLGESIFGVRLEPRPERRAWHPDVRAFDLVDRDTGRLISELFVDPYVRDGKGSNAWADCLDPGEDAGFGEARPRVMVLVTNAPAPSEGSSTISLYELDTLFHEYGHILDFALDSSRWWPMRDDWERYDWVEGPSVFLGEWSLRAPVLRAIGRHHETGEPIPDSMLASLEALNGLNAGFKTLRHVSMARVDGLVHGPDPISIDEADARAWAVRRLPPVDGANFTATFAHLLGGYDGAVHGFAFDTMLKDDLTAGFEEGGMLSPEVGARYRAAVLEAPWTLDPLERVARFRGRPWSYEPFLRRLGG